MTQLGTVTRTDLTTAGGPQPRVSPKADSVVYTNVNDTTGKRDLFRMSDKGGAGKNLTDTPDIDEHDPAFSPDGSKIAFVSDQAEDPTEKRRNYDIWIMDLANGEKTTQLTTNGSWDDSPQWDPQGNAIYFRSNRGGEWAIWRIELPKQ
jgi:Tol biopolymer transport system component